MFVRRSCFLLMILLSWTSPFQAQQLQTMILARPRPVPVPDFTGKTLEQVHSEDVVPGSKQQLFASISSQGPDNGVVATQSPAAGTPVVPGASRLFLTMAAPKPSALQTFLNQLVASIPKTVRVPNLEGATRDRASRDLEVVRLKASFTGDATGTVVQQYPPAGTEVRPGSVVTVTLAIPEVVVPSLYGLTLEQATARLKDNSLQTGKIDGENTPGSTVTAQAPPAGAQEPPGSEVAVSIAPEQQPVPIYVPNLRKMSRSEAEAALEKVGLRTGQVTGSNAGFVSDQQPRAGTAVDPETAVDFTLSLPTVVVPDVLNDTEAAATTSLQNFGLQPEISRAANWDDTAQHIVVEQDPPPGNNVNVGSGVRVTLGNLSPPPPAWKVELGRLAAALPLAPWWFWLLIGVPLGAIGVAVIKGTAGVIKRLIGPHPLPAAHCTLEPERAEPGVRFGNHGAPKVQFTVALKDRNSVARCRVGLEPEVRQREEIENVAPGRND